MIKEEIFVKVTFFKKKDGEYYEEKDTGRFCKIPISEKPIFETPNCIISIN